MCRTPVRDRGGGRRLPHAEPGLRRARAARAVRVGTGSEALSCKGPLSGPLESGDRDGAHGLQPDAAARDVPNLSGHRERPVLLAQDVDPADLAEPQRRRRRQRHPEPVLARVFRAPEQGLVVDPQPNRPGDWKSRVPAALRCRAHLGNRLTGTLDGCRRAWWTSDETQCPWPLYTFRAI